jgi:hypothetical protein
LSDILKRAADFIVSAASLPAAEITHVLSDFEHRAFRPIANNQFPTNPFIIMIERRDGEIFKVRNPIRKFRDKSVDILYRAAIRKYRCKDSEMNQGGE